MSSFKLTITLICLLSASSLIGKIWVGGTPGSEGVWDEANNWSPVGVPQMGDSLLFPDVFFENIKMDTSYTSTGGLTLQHSPERTYTFTTAGSGVFLWSGSPFSVNSGPNNLFAVPIKIANSGVLTIAPANGTSINFGSTITDDTSSTGSVEIFGEGGGSVIFSGTNSYTGPTTIVRGNLIAGSANAFPLNSDMIVGDSNGFPAQLNLGSHSFTIKSLSGSPQGEILTSSGSVILTVADGANKTFHGIISDVSGTVGLTLTTGSLTLTGVNTYNGGTIINTGEL